MRAEAKDRLSIVFGAASACSLLWASGAFAQQEGRAPSPVAGLSAEELAGDPLQQTVADLLEVLLTDFPADALLVNWVPELPYLHHPAKAAALLEYTLDHNPGNSMLCRLMAEMTFQKGEYAKAITYFRRVSKLSGETWEIRNRIAESLIALGRYQDVVDDLEEKVRGPNVPGRSYYLLGQAFAQLGNYTRARECYEKALETHPKNPELAYALGNLFMRSKEPGKAKPYLEAFRKQQLARKTSALEAAKKRAEPEVHHAATPVPWERAEIANILINLCARGSKLYRESQRTERAEHVLKQGQGAFEQAINLSPEQPELYRDAARLYLLAGKSPAKAARLSEQAVALEPSAQNYLALGRAFRANAEDGKAIAAIRRSAELEPEWLAPKNDLAWILATHEDAAIRQPEEAVRLAEQAAALVRYRNPHVLETLAAAYATAGQFARAQKVAGNALGMARAANNEALVADIGRQLELYQDEQPYREPD